MRAKRWRSARCRRFLFISRSRMPSSEVPGASSELTLGRAAVAQQLPPDSREGEPDRVLVEAAEPMDRPLVILDGEAPERGVLTVDPIQPGSIEPREEGVTGVLDIELAVRQFRQDRTEPRLDDPLAQFPEIHPFADQARILRSLADPGRESADRSPTDSNPRRDFLLRVEQVGQELPAFQERVGLDGEIAADRLLQVSPDLGDRCRPDERLGGLVVVLVEEADGPFRLRPEIAPVSIPDRGDIHRRESERSTAMEAISDPARRRPWMDARRSGR